MDPKRDRSLAILQLTLCYGRLRCVGRGKSPTIHRPILAMYFSVFSAYVANKRLH